MYFKLQPYITLLFFELAASAVSLMWTFGSFLLTWAVAVDGNDTPKTAASSGPFGGHAPHDVPTEDICAINRLAFEFAETIRPLSSASQLHAVHEALQLGAQCHHTFDWDRVEQRVAARSAAATEAAGVGTSAPAPAPPSLAASPMLYVCCTTGDDANGDGSVTSPLLTAHEALRRLRNRDTGGLERKTIVLKAGIHYFNDTLVLTEADSHTTIKGEPGAWISGGV